MKGIIKRAWERGKRKEEIRRILNMEYYDAIDEYRMCWSIFNIPIYI